MEVIKIQRFKINDLETLEEIMRRNEKYSAPGRNWKKFLQWNISHPEDLYWKIVLPSGQMIGYIGFAFAKDKETTRDYTSSQEDLFLEIYFHPDYVGGGRGIKAYTLALDQANKILSFKPKKVFASTYIFNIHAREFFKKKCGMKFSHYIPKYRVFVYDRKINENKY